MDIPEGNSCGFQGDWMIDPAQFVLFISNPPIKGGEAGGWVAGREGGRGWGSVGSGES